MPSKDSIAAVSALVLMLSGICYAYVIRPDPDPYRLDKKLPSACTVMTWAPADCIRIK